MLLLMLLEELQANTTIIKFSTATRAFTARNDEGKPMLHTI